LFGVEVPKPLIDAVSRGKKFELNHIVLEVVSTPYSMPAEAEHQFDYYHPTSQAWINKCMYYGS